jgi:hypothetical protein
VSIPKHEATKKREKKPAQPQQPNTVVLVGPESRYPSQPSMQHDINHVAGLAGVEESLDWIAKGINRLTSDGQDFSLSTASNANPVKITLSDNDENDTMSDLVTALQRIADSVAKLAGLNRPRLESWHEQDEYVPRYRDSACDGGVPEPKTNAA